MILRTAPLFALGGLACWGLAALLLWFPEIAAVLGAAAFGLGGLALFALALVVGRAEAAFRRAVGGRPPAAGPLRNADASWRNPERPPER